MCMKLLCNLVNHLWTKCVILSKGLKCSTADVQERSPFIENMFYKFNKMGFKKIFPI